jgi:hypothetical protein
MCLCAVWSVLALCRTDSIRYLWAPVVCTVHVCLLVLWYVLGTCCLLGCVHAVCARRALHGRAVCCACFWCMWYALLCARDLCSLHAGLRRAMWFVPGVCALAGLSDVPGVCALAGLNDVCVTCQLKAVFACLMMTQVVQLGKDLLFMLVQSCCTY